MDGDSRDASPTGMANASIVDGGDGEASPDGNQPVLRPPCATFDRAKLRITAERCLRDGGGCVRPPIADVRLVSLIYYPEECLCTGDGDCEAGTLCRKDALSLDAGCWSDHSCRGICTP